MRNRKYRAQKIANNISMEMIDGMECDICIVYCICIYIYTYIYKFQQENDMRLSQIGGKTGFTPENDQHTEGTQSQRGWWEKPL